MKTYYKITINNKEYTLTQMDYEVLLRAGAFKAEDAKKITK